MSISLPSIPIFIADVPEIKELLAQFQYNFFTADESINSNGSIDSSTQKINSIELNEEFVKSQVSKLPRVNLIQFKLPNLALNSDEQIQEQDGTLISRNIDNVITEQEFSNGNYVALTFSDAEIDDKLFYLISGSTNIKNVFEEKTENINTKITNSFKETSISKTSLRNIANNKPRLNGTRYFDKQGKRIFNSYYKSLKSVNSNMQISSRVIDDILNTSVDLPFSVSNNDFITAKKEAQKIPTTLKKSKINELDYKTYLKYIDVIKINNSVKDKYVGRIVGYIIDKAEILNDGNFIQHDPIIIDDARVNFTADFRIKYNSTYVYSIRTVALFSIPAIDEDNNEVNICKVLISSKPSQNYYVQTIEVVSPPPPSNLNFVWDYERINPSTAEFDVEKNKINLQTGIPGSLMITWNFPINSQRDIKKFQVFRRKSINDPFELLKVYDFDDSAILFPDLENIDSSIIEKVTSPVNYYFDDEFIKSSKYIYSICSIDAHGLTSGYSEQFEVWFDEYTNKIHKKLISHSGSPKPYPNLYLENDLLQDSIRVSGPSSKRLKIYFNPEAYSVYNDNGKTEDVFLTTKNGSYIFNAINLDNQKFANLNIEIEDQSKKIRNITNRRVFLERK